jgi:uncharacterized FlaG/YvyC family protein
MLSAIFELLNKIFSWFTPERRDKAKRELRTQIEKTLRQLKKQKWTPELARKVEKLEEKLEKINNSLSA